MRNPWNDSGGPLHPKASNGFRQDQGELGSPIALAVQRLNTVVATELGHLVDTVKKLKEENAKLREQLFGSALGPSQLTCGFVGEAEMRSPKMPWLDIDEFSVKEPFRIAICPMPIKCVPSVKPAVECDEPIGEGDPCSDQHVKVDEAGRDSTHHRSQRLKSLDSERSAERSTLAPQAMPIQAQPDTLASVRTVRFSPSVDKAKMYELLDFFVSEKNSGSPLQLPNLGVFQTDHSFQRALCTLNEGTHKPTRMPSCSNLKPYMMSPMSPLSIAIDILAVILILYDCVAVPLLLLQDAGSTTHVAITFMLWVSRIFWTLAIPRTFITGVMEPDGRIEVDPVLTAKKYCQTWLIFDVVIVITDWLESKSVGVQRMLRLSKAARLARIFQVPNTIVSQFNYAKSERMLLWLSILKSMFTFVLVNHILACVWFWVGAQTRHDGWVSKIGLDGATMLEKYTYSLHWSASQFEGSTEVMPKSSSERAFGACVMLFAFIWSASFVSNVTAALTRLQHLSSQKGKEFSALQRFLASSGISGQLAMRVLKSAKFLVMESEKNQAEADIKLLHMLSQPMLNEIHYEMHSGHLMQHPFFWHYNVHEPLALQKLCHSAITVLKLGSTDILFAQGEQPTDPHMFFVVSGTLFYIKDFDGDGNVDPHEMAKVTSPMWVCEPNLWLKWTHVGNLRAATHCSILALSAKMFRKVIAEYVVTSYPALYAAQLVAMMNDAVEDNLVHEHGVDDLLTGIDVSVLVRDVFPHYLASTKKLFGVRTSSFLRSMSLVGFK